MKKLIRYAVVIACCGALLSACGDSKERVPADAPGFIKGKAVHPTIKIGKPYRVKGKKYYPEYEPDYDEEGLASWYGPNFHGKMTANGEKYNQWAMTAAHKTLPLPSMVKVTNLKTGKSIVVRVNDRGPFASGRIIDLSRAAAEELGTRARGIAKVRVQYLPAETEAYIAKLQLKKPKSMREIDNARAKIASALKTAHAVSAPKPEVVSTSHVIEKASNVPTRFAYEAPESGSNITTTVDVRGVSMEESGYAEDAFSVLNGSVTALAKPQPQQTASWQQPIAEVQQYYVRAGTFSDERNAYALAKKLRGIAATQVQQLTILGNEFWRVSLGPAFNRGIAEEIREKLTQHAIYDAAIVKEE